jgi:hypothetical protein
VSEFGGRGSGLGAQGSGGGARSSPLGSRGWALGFVALLPFILLATANSAGYRYGASDLAFYGPAVMRQLDPTLFPRDTPVIDAQAQLTFMDETVGAVSRLTTSNFPTLFLSLYLLTLVLLALAIGAIGESLYESRWTVLALLGALTLRHAIAKSGTNSLEGYFHPRQLAFAFGMLAVAAFLRGRLVPAALALGAAGTLHPTTTLWLGIWLATATFVARPQWRAPLAIAGAALLVLATWALTYGPLAGRLTLMDQEWLTALGEKDYLFPLGWPFVAWVANLGYIVLILWFYRRRKAAGLTTAAESGLVAGCMALAGTFGIAVALNAARVALAIQLQPARVFWILDVMATIYVVWALAEGKRETDGDTRVASGEQSRVASGFGRKEAGFRLPPEGGSHTSAAGAGIGRSCAVAAAVATLSLIRGAYVMRVEFPKRPLFETRVPGDWGRVAEWAQATPKDSGWLADPFHAARYGTSLRMAAARDVFVEGTKDAAIGMYDRRVALRTRDRLVRVRDFADLSAEAARALGVEYQLDYLVSEATLTLPLAFQSGTIRVYRLR